MKLTMLTAVAALLSGGLMLNGSKVRALTMPVAVVGASDLRDEIRERIRLEVTPLKTEAQVDGYLAGLRLRARMKGRVTPLEVAPGLRAIRQLVGTIPLARLTEKELAFGDEMQKLAGELR